MFAGPSDRAAAGEPGCPAADPLRPITGPILGPGRQLSYATGLGPAVIRVGQR
jgi:hypothetical protein